MKWQIALIVGIFIVSISLNVIPSFRNGLQSFFGFNDHQVLSALKGYYVSENLQIDIFKIKREGRIFVEIYEHQSTKILQKIPFQEEFDGYFQYLGRSANLFINDINGDRKAEVIVPLINKNLVASLHVLQYDQKSRRFYYYQSKNKN